MEDLRFLQNTYNNDGNIEDQVRPKIVIVEDDRVLGISIKKYLEKVMNCNVVHYLSTKQCLDSIDNNGEYFCLVTDISLEQGADGLFLIDALKDKGLKFVSIAMTGFASVENAIAATKKGVYHYLTKPFELDSLRKVINGALSLSLGVENDSSDETTSKKLPRKENIIKLEKPVKDDIFCNMIGRSEVMKTVFERIRKVALTDSTVLIQGPSGTGKELVAQAIHNLSNRSINSCVSVNCGAIPRDLLESELFGHMKGSFTGAISDRKGRFEVADKGTIFLDEIGDMPHLLQVKLLRVLQSQTIEPVGSTKAIQVDSRVVAATHRNLEQMVSENKFREDLFYRLNVIPIKIPELKERKEDIPLLISYFLTKFTSADQSNMIHFTQEAMSLMIGYDWPGNVRELENIIERLVILRGGNEILAEDLPAKIFRHNPLQTNEISNFFELPKEGIDLKNILADIENSLIVQALKYTGGNKNQASKLLSLNRTTLIEKMKKKSIDFSHNP